MILKISFVFDFTAQCMIKIMLLQRGHAISIERYAIRGSLLSFPLIIVGIFNINICSSYMPFISLGRIYMLQHAFATHLRLVFIFNICPRQFCVRNASYIRRTSCLYSVVTFLISDVCALLISDVCALWRLHFKLSCFC